MKTTTQHTPLPWHVDVMGYLRGPNNENILEVKENAEFIVSAVHSHEALLESLKYLHEEYIHTHKIGAPPKIGCHECEVIAQAEGKGE